MNHFRRMYMLFPRTAGQMLPALLLCAVLGGCATGSSSWFPGWSDSSAPQGQEALAKTGAGPLADFLAANAPGAQGGVKDPVYGTVQVSVTESYISALGENCRKAMIAGGARQTGTEQVAACQNSDGKWRVLPALLAPARSPQSPK